MSFFDEVWDVTQVVSLIAYSVLTVLSSRWYERDRPSRPGPLWLLASRRPALGLLLFLLLVVCVALLVPGLSLLKHGAPNLYYSLFAAFILVVVLSYGLHLVRAYRARRRTGYLLLQSGALVCWSVAMLMLYVG